MAAVEKIVKKLAATDDPARAIGTAFDEAVTEFVRELQRFDPVRLIEVARLAFLPITFEGDTSATAEAGATQVELLALIALAAQQEASDASVPEAATVQDQEMSHFISEAKERLVELIRLANLRSLATVDQTDKFAMVSLLVQSTEIWIRNSSYPEMVGATNLELLDGEPTVRAALNAEFGFDATDALAVLNACHDIQQDNMNSRAVAMRTAVFAAMTSAQNGEPDRKANDLARAGFMSLFEPDANGAMVTVEELATRTGIFVARARDVIYRFRLDLGAATPAEVVEEFIAGKNPMRARPLIVSDDGRIMLPHPALNVVAVRENLEEHLKTSPVWSKYAKHRGDLLESRTRAALGRVLPGANFRDGIEYYIPANDAEEKAADPAKYTKRVEGDHLILLDDVAVIVEDKAVAFSALSRAGKTSRIRRDLTGIITNAADQASRMRDAIERDGGLRIEGEGWVDLSHVREIHTITVSLDDLSTVLSATAELVRAGVLSLDCIPWTVSLHDLELITELVARPAEFLLYLRRRRDPNTTVMFAAADELDFFLYFYEAGLWVEPDPVQVRAAFPFLPAPTTAELRRYRLQEPRYLTSRTDALDAWFYAKNSDGTESATVLKPAMAPTPLGSLIDALNARNVTGWLSIGATLLSMATSIQHQFARNGDDLLNSPSPNGSGRSLTVPVTGSVDPAEGWLFVWATRPLGEDLASAVNRVRDYLRAKKHQLSIPRGVVFLFDEPTRSLIDAYYDGHIGPLDSALTATVSRLRPAAELRNRLPPKAKQPPRKTQGKSNSKQKKKPRR